VDALSVLPAEDADITFIDADGVVRYFSEYRIFSRPMGCLNADVLLCHSAERRDDVRGMIAEFRDGWRDEAFFLSRKGERLVDVRYVAVRDIDSVYLGCVEVAQWAAEQAE
jgi:DUF438 domain-containing protein